MFPVGGITAKIGDQEGNNGQCYCDGYISGKIGCSGQKAQKVAKKNKEKQCENVGQIFLRMMTQVWPDNFVAYKYHHGLDKRLQAFGCFARISFVGSGYRKEYQ